MLLRMSEGPFGRSRPVALACGFPSICPGWHRGWIEWPGSIRRIDDAARIHETGQQLLQTGRLCRAGDEHPHVGSVVGRLRGASRGLPPFAILPGPIANTGVDVPHGQSAGWLGNTYNPFHLNADPAASHFDAQSALDLARSFVDEAVRRDPSGGLALSRTTDSLLTAPAAQCV